MRLDSYLSTLEPPALADARRLARVWLDDGMSVDEFVTEILAPAQEEVGRRWERNEWTVAQEHGATAITDAVLGAIAQRADSAQTSRPRTGRVVTCCVEGEWHTMPLRMLHIGLTAAGHDVVFLGASIPPPHLTRFLRDTDPIALLANCTVALHFPGARRTIAAAHDAGVPVLVGGRAFGPTGARAARLGADAWAPDAGSASAIIDEWAVRRPRLAPVVDVTSEQIELEIPHSDLVDSCLREIQARVPGVREMPDVQTTRTREDIVYILRFCSAALVVDDPSVLDEFTIWLRDMLAPRGVGVPLIAASYAAIADVLRDASPVAAAMVARSSALVDDIA